jgi:hypothetical protein
MASLLFLFLPFCALAQEGWSGETESGADGKHEVFFSQYVNYDTKNWNILTRYFWVKGVVNRGEFAAGPTFKVTEHTVVKLQFGGTTNKAVMAAGTILTEVRQHSVLYIADAKFSTTGTPNTLFQKVFVALNKKGSVQLRAEHLQVGKSQDFLRLGLEYQHNMPGKTQLFVAPFFDPVRKTGGLQGGFRFF